MNSAAPISSSRSRIRRLILNSCTSTAAAATKTPMLGGRYHIVKLAKIDPQYNIIPATGA
jgi:hypothetical protein